MSGPWDDYAAAQGTTPSTATPHATDPNGPWKDFSGLLPQSGSPASSGGDRPLTIQPLKASPEIQVDIHNPQAIKEAINTLDPSQAPGVASSALSGAVQGATLNFGDELRGLAAAGGNPLIPGSQIVGGLRMAGEALLPGTFGHAATDRYNQAASQARAENEIAQQTNPGSYFAGELGGGLAALPIAPELAPFEAAQGAGLAARGGAALGNMAATGAAYGGAAGIGGAQDGLQNRVVGGLEGAALGGVVNPAFGGAASALTGGVGRAANLVRQDLMARNDPQRLADQIIARRLHEDGTTPADLAQGMTDAPAPVLQNGSIVQPQGPQAPTGLRTAADVGGANLQKLAGSIARGGGEAENEARAFVNARQFGDDAVPSQGDRVQGAITRLMGGKNLASDAIDQIIATRSAQAAPAYELARSTPIDYATKEGQALMANLDRVPQSARANANAILQVSDRGGSQLVYRPNQAGEMELQSAPNVRQWDYIKQGLDQLIDSHTSDTTGKVDTYGREVVLLKKELLSGLDKLVPAYGTARKIFAGHSETIGAMKDGLEAFRPGTSPDDMRRALAGLQSSADRDAYKMAAAKGLKDRLGGFIDGADKAREISKTPDLREKIAIIAKDEASRTQLMRFIQNERSMTQLRGRMTGNSATAERIAADSALSENVENLREGIHAAHNIAHLNVTGLLLQAARHLQKINPEMRSAVLNEARKVILNPDPMALRSFEDRVAAASLPTGARQAVAGLLRSALKNSKTAALRGTVGQTLQQSQSTQPDAPALASNRKAMR